MEHREVICLKCRHHFLIRITSDQQLEEVPDGEAFQWHCPCCNQPTYAEFCEAKDRNLSEEEEFLEHPADWFLEKEHTCLDG